MNQRRQHPFSAPFLIAVQDGIARRAKALSHKGRVTIRAHVGEREWMELSVVPARGGAVILVARECNEIDVYIRSTASHDRGRVLFRAEGMRVPSNPALLLEAFERTLASMHGEWDVAELRRVWQQISIRLVPS